MIYQSHPQRPMGLGDEARLERLRATVSQAALFRGLGAAAVDDLCRRVQVRTRMSGAVMVHADEPGDALFLIHEGKARVAVWGENGREVTLAVLGPGDFFGEMSLLDGSPRSANVIAVDDLTVLVLSRDAFVDHLRAHPQTGLNLLAELSRRLRRANESITSLALQDVNRRLVRTLERLARQDGEKVEGGLLLRRRPTQQDLANMVGSCRETVSRAFTAMIKKGLMVPRGRALLLTDRLLAA